MVPGSCARTSLVPWPAVTTSARPTMLADADQVAVGLDRARVGAFDDRHPALAQHPRQRGGHRAQVDHAGVGLEAPDVRVEEREARGQRLAVERLGLQAEAREHLVAALRVGAREVGRDLALGDVHPAAADQRPRPGPRLELAPQAEGLVREARVGRLEVVVAERAGAAERRRQRVADAAALEHGHALPRRSDAWYAVKRPITPPPITIRSAASVGMPCRLGPRLGELLDDAREGAEQAVGRLALARQVARVGGARVGLQRPRPGRARSA